MPAGLCDERVGYFRARGPSIRPKLDHSDLVRLVPSHGLGAIGLSVLGCGGSTREVYVATALERIHANVRCSSRWNLDIARAFAWRAASERWLLPSSPSSE